MRLYPCAGQVALIHDGVQYGPGEDGGFDLPEPVAQHLVTFHVNGKPLWEMDTGHHAGRGRGGTQGTG